MSKGGDPPAGKGPSMTIALAAIFVAGTITLLVAGWFSTVVED
jgi:hypothetical protein